MKRSLRLRSEALRSLTTDELGGVAGAAGDDQLSVSCPATDCVSHYTCRLLLELREVLPSPTSPQNCNSLFC